MKTLLLILAVLLNSIFVSTKCYCDEAISFSWSNDENRTLIGQGYWIYPPVYESCWGGVNGNSTLIIEGYWGVGEAYLWVDTGDLEISEIDLSLGLNADEHLNSSPCRMQLGFTNNITTVSSFDLNNEEDCHYLIIEGMANGHVLLNGCQKGLFWILLARWSKVGWLYIGAGGEATLCDGSKMPIKAAGYYLNPEYPQPVSNENSSWGAIKSLYK